MWYLVRQVPSWGEWRVIVVTEFQAFDRGEKKPHAYKSRRQAHAVCGRLNGKAKTKTVKDKPKQWRKT